MTKIDKNKLFFMIRAGIMSEKEFDEKLEYYQKQITNLLASDQSKSQENLLDIRNFWDALSVTSWAQLIHFFNPDRKIFIPIAWSIAGGADNGEVDKMKWIFPQYNNGPLWKIWQNFDKKGKLENIFRRAKTMDNSSLIKITMEDLKFTTFLIIPLVLSNRFLGTATVFFIKPEKYRQAHWQGRKKFKHISDTPSAKKFRKLVQIITSFYVNGLEDLRKNFEVAKYQKSSVRELGQNFGF